MMMPLAGFSSVPFFAPPPPAKVQLRFGKWIGEGDTHEMALNRIREQSFNEVQQHEQEHLNALPLHLRAGGPEYTKNEHGITVGGQVKLRMGFDPNNPEQTMRDAKAIQAAALKPHDPSDQDRKVAAQAQANYAKAALLLQQRQALPSQNL